MSYINALYLTNPDTHSYTLYVLILDALIKVKNSYNVSLNESTMFSSNTVDSSPKCNGRVLNLEILIWVNFNSFLNRNESVINMSVGAACFFIIFVAVSMLEILTVLFAINSSSPNRMCMIEYGADTRYVAFC